MISRLAAHGSRSYSVATAVKGVGNRCVVDAGASRNFGSFEQHHIPPPRFFLVTYQLNAKEYERQVLADGAPNKSALMREHGECC